MKLKVLLIPSKLKILLISTEIKGITNTEIEIKSVNEGTVLNLRYY